MNIDATIQTQTVNLDVQIKGIGPLVYSTTREDIVYLYHVTVNDEWRDYYVAYAGPVKEDLMPDIAKINKEVLPVRIDSGCITSMVFGDRTCECHEQLQMAMALIREHGPGFVIHIPSQDGRGMGIDFKLGTLELQYADGYDTVGAARELCHSDHIDRRTYHGAVAILKAFGLNGKHKLNLATNNPKKMEVFTQAGFKIETETRMHIQATELTERHLRAKKKYLSHILDF